jgi:Tol biopolymer transport system component
VWTRDDSAIIFAKDRDGDERHNLHLLDLHSGQVTQLNEVIDKFVEGGIAS